MVKHWPWKLFNLVEAEVQTRLQVSVDRPSTWEKTTVLTAFKDFWNPQVYRAGFVEFITSGMYVFLSLATVITALQSEFESNLAAMAFIHVLLVAFFISSALPVSGGHFNPILTFTTFLTGHTSLPRAVMYIICQLGGSVLGALAVKAILNPIVSYEYSLGGCLFQQEISKDGVRTLAGLSAQQAFIAEFVFTFIYLHVNYALGLDPKQAPVYGPVVGPLFCGILVGVNIFISGNLQEGYGGAGFNPARCLGPAVAMGGQQPYLRHQYWVFALAPFWACMVQGLVFHVVKAPSTKKKETSQQVESFV